MPFVFIATLSASFSVQARGAEPGLGPEDQLAAVERGRSKQRIVLAAQNRQILGMVVLQPRLLRDLMAYSSQLPANVAAAQKIVKQLDGLARFLTSGERSAFPDSLAYDWGYDWGYVTEPESSPISAQGRWLTDLGIAEGEILGGDFIIVASGISLNVMYVVDHRDEAGDLATVLPPNPPPMPKKLSAAEVDQLGAPSPAPQIAHAQATDTSAWGPDPLRAYDVALAKRIEERYPTPAYPSISADRGLSRMRDSASR